MKGISLWQPYAQLIPTGFKKIETRRWRPKNPDGSTYLGEIAIIATKNFPDDARNVCDDFPFYEALGQINLFKGNIDQWIENLPLGAIIGTAEIYEYVRTQEVDKNVVGEIEILFGNYKPGRWAWYLRNPKLLSEPIPYKGKLTAIDLAEEVIKQIKEQTN